MCYQKGKGFCLVFTKLSVVIEFVRMAQEEERTPEIAGQNISSKVTGFVVESYTIRYQGKWF